MMLDNSTLALKMLSRANQIVHTATVGEGDTGSHLAVALFVATGEAIPYASGVMDTTRTMANAEPVVQVYWSVDTGTGVPCSVIARHLHGDAMWVRQGDHTPNALGDVCHVEVG